MSKYLDPKADLTFKRVFGDHPDLAISLLNALLPFDKEEDYIKEIEYLSPEMVPDNPLRKDSIVDVRCKDGRGRQFLVEMQMLWSPEFKQRVLFNASKAYVRQLGRSKDYVLLQPVYSLNIVNEVFESDLEGYYHYYRMVHSEHNDRVIDGLHLVFVELPKFKPHTFAEKRMQVLWLRYLTEIDERTRQVSDDLLENTEIRKAVEVVEEAAYTPEQMAAYDKFWDIVRTEATLFGSAERRGLNKGLAEGRAKGIAEGRAKGIAEGRAKGLAEGRAEGRAKGLVEGRAEGRAKGLVEGRAEGQKDEKKAIATKMKESNIPIEQIQAFTGLSKEEIEAL